MKSSRRRVTCLISAVALAAALPLVQAGAASSAGSPDLVVASLTRSVSSVKAGGSLTLTAVTKNRGEAGARSSVTRFYLSKDKVRSSRDPALGDLDVPRLAAGRKETGKQKVRVPSDTTARAYWVIACADATKRVAESREGNNCRVSGTQLVVRSAGVFPQTPDPLTVTSSTDDARSVSGDYSLFSGLTLNAQGADGTTYALHLPGQYQAGATPPVDIHREALAADGTTVTMTPVSSVSGLPGTSALLAGVKLEPEGLLLENPGTLTITGPGLTSANVADQTGVVWNADGEDLSMSPILVPSQGGSAQANTVVLSISHFSSPGVAAANAADRQFLLDHPPAREREQLQAMVASVLQPEHVKAVNGQPTDPAAISQTIQLYNDWFDHVVVHELNAALTDETIADTALNDAFAWERYVMLLGVDPGSRGDLITTLLPQIVQNVVDKSYTRCVVDHHLPDILRMVQIAHFAAVLFHGTDPQSADAWTKAQKCAHFQARLFDVSSTSAQHYSPSGAFVDSRTLDGHWALPQVNIDLSWTTPGASTPSAYDSAGSSYAWTDTSPGPDSCGGTVTVTTTMDTTTGGQISGRLGLDDNAYEIPPGQSAPVAAGGKLTLVFSGFSESYTSHNECTGASSPFTADRFLEALGFAFGSSASPTITVTFKAVDQLADLLADKTLSPSVGLGDRSGPTYSGHAHVLLYHTPVQP